MRGQKMIVLQGKFRKNFLFLFFFLSSLSLSYSFSSLSICGASVEEPWFMVNDSGTPVFIVDSDGDMFFYGQSHPSSGSGGGFSFGSYYFDLASSVYPSGISHSLSSVSSSASGNLNFQGSDGSVVASFSSSGISTKGDVIAEGEQAGCSSDGWYCNGILRENRDYSCDLFGTTGACGHSVVGSENCATKTSFDSDASSSAYLTSGTVRDFLSCDTSNPTSCTFNSYSDSCSGSLLTEYSVSGSSYSSNSKNCNDYEHNYCRFGDEIWFDHWGCGSGACQDESDSLVQACVASASTYSSWSCSGYSQRVKTRTDYTPVCVGGSSPSCSQTSTNTQIYESAPSGTACVNGDFKSTSWSVGSWGSCSANPSWSSWSSCSASCGGGTQSRSCYGTSGSESRSVVCKTSTGVTVPDSYCTSSKPSTSRSCSESCSGSSVQSCNTQACCTPSYSNVCLGSNVYRENSCTGGLSFVQSCSYGCSGGSCDSAPSYSWSSPVKISSYEGSTSSCSEYYSGSQKSGSCSSSGSTNTYTHSYCDPDGVGDEDYIQDTYEQTCQ